jgi:hypothetical protein
MLICSHCLSRFVRGLCIKSNPHTSVLLVLKMKFLRTYLLYTQGDNEGRKLRDQEIAGSNPAAPTTIKDGGTEFHWDEFRLGSRSLRWCDPSEWRACRWISSTRLGQLRNCLPASAQYPCRRKPRSATAVLTQPPPTAARRLSLIKRHVAS